MAQWIEERRPKLLIAGVTNVGKSHVIARILGMRLGRKQRHRVMPTVSAYPRHDRVVVEMAAERRYLAG